MNAVEVKHLSKVFGTRKAVDDVSFELPEGSFLSIFGPNGAGKTTTVKAMLNLIHPDSGSVCFFGMPLAGNETEIKKRIGYSTGTVSWYPRKKIGNIIDIVKRFYDTWDEEACRTYLDLFRIDARKTPLELSEGMKVKYSIALALSHTVDVSLQLLVGVEGCQARKVLVAETAAIAVCTTPFGVSCFLRQTFEDSALQDLCLCGVEVELPAARRKDGTYETGYIQNL